MFFGDCIHQFYIFFGEYIHQYYIFLKKLVFVGFALGMEAASFFCCLIPAFRDWATKKDIANSPTCQGEARSQKGTPKN
jgi:hypothetical protein